MNENAIVGQRFGRYIAISYAFSNKHRSRVYLCICDCGSEKYVNGAELKNGSTKSCGCYHRDRMKQIHSGENNHSYKHGDKHTKLYRTWQAMKARCYDPNNISFKYYGSKNIIVCDEWLKSYQTFKQWALVYGYADGLSIDRINHKGNYEPMNCQWLTRSENTAKNNKERNHVRTTNI